MSWPASWISPSLAGLRPEITSNKLVVPARLGQVIHGISPWATSKLRWETAASAPNLLLISRQDRIGVWSAVMIVPCSGARSGFDPRRQFELASIVRRRRDQHRCLGMILDLQVLMRHAERRILHLGRIGIDRLLIGNEAAGAVDAAIDEGLHARRHLLVLLCLAWPAGAAGECCRQRPDIAAVIRLAAGEMRGIGAKFRLVALFEIETNVIL